MNHSQALSTTPKRVSRIARAAAVALAASVAILPAAAVLDLSAANLRAITCDMNGLQWTQYNLCTSVSGSRCMGDAVLLPGGAQVSVPRDGYDACARSPCPGWSCAEGYVLVQNYANVTAASAGRYNILLDTVGESEGWPCYCAATAAATPREALGEGTGSDAPARMMPAPENADVLTVPASSPSAKRDDPACPAYLFECDAAQLATRSGGKAVVPYRYFSRDDLRCHCCADGARPLHATSASRDCVAAAFKGDVGHDRQSLPAATQVLHEFECDVDGQKWTQFNRCKDAIGGMCVGDEVSTPCGGTWHLYDPCSASPCRGWTCTDPEAYGLMVVYDAARGFPQWNTPNVIVGSDPTPMQDGRCVCVPRMAKDRISPTPTAASRAATRAAPGSPGYVADSATCVAAAFTCTGFENSFLAYSDGDCLCCGPADEPYNFAVQCFPAINLSGASMPSGAASSSTTEYSSSSA